MCMQVGWTLACTAMRLRVREQIMLLCVGSRQMLTFTIVSINLGLLSFILCLQFKSDTGSPNKPANNCVVSFLPSTSGWLQPNMVASGRPH